MLMKAATRNLFYRYDYGVGSQYSEEVSIKNKFETILWKPSMLEIIPKGVALFPFAVWWVMHYLHIFANRDYGLYLVYDRDNLIHRSVISPGYFRFPFMAKIDLQIGDTWTKSEYRGKGLAVIAVTQIIQLLRKPGRRFWYLTEESNQASIRVIEKVGFEKVGEGSRTKRCGLSVLGAFVIDKTPTKE